MTIEIEEVTVKDGIVRITALNCSEYLTYWLHHQKVTAGCKTYGEAFYRIRGTVTTISGKYLEPAA